MRLHQGGVKDTDEELLKQFEKGNGRSKDLVIGFCCPASVVVRAFRPAVPGRPTGLHYD
jgi:hypothetical protein